MGVSNSGYHALPASEVVRVSDRLDSGVKHVVTCVTCLVRSEWSDLEAAELDYGLHEDHRGSSLVPVAEVTA